MHYLIYFLMHYLMHYLLYRLTRGVDATVISSP